MAKKAAVVVEDDGVPAWMKTGGPPPVKNHTGGDLIRERLPVHEVALPGGVFRLVWELVEAKAKQTCKYKETIPHATEAMLDAVRAFREAAGDAFVEDGDDDEVIVDEDDEVIEDEDEILEDDDEIIEDDDEVL